MTDEKTTVKQANVLQSGMKIKKTFTNHNQIVFELLVITRQKTKLDFTSQPVVKELGL